MISYTGSTDNISTDAEEDTLEENPIIEAGKIVHKTLMSIEW